MTVIGKVHGELISLPDLIHGPIKYEIGYASHLLSPATLAHVISDETIRISPRISERCVHFENGERIIVTERNKMNIPEGVDGVLQVSGSENRWIAHRKLESAQIKVEQEGLCRVSDDACATWRDMLRYTAEKVPISSDRDRGLRPPQLGALFAIGSHWSLLRTPATIVMPTGTGKTETMLAACVAHQLKRVLVAVPSKALRGQISRKFLKLGLLRELNVLDHEVSNPVVGVALRRPKSSDDLALFRDCNVVVGVPSSLSSGTAILFLEELAASVDALFVDEAHHIRARTWQNLRDAFLKRRILQFTATPYRNDDRIVDGSVIYSYPLGAAQDDGYFTKINFNPIYELVDEKADIAIANAAIQKLREDISENFNHLLMARCKTVDRAKDVYQIYSELAPDLNPLLVYSALTDADERVMRLSNHESRIVVCVNMLGEGVDIPALKIAAVHDSHQSLAVLLQFIGRFARRGDDRIGEARVIANIANPKVSIALEQLYSQDADWNSVLREKSSEAAYEHAELIRFLEQSVPFEIGNNDAWEMISKQSLRPIFSTLVFHANSFHPKRFHLGLSDRHDVIKVWLNKNAKTLYFVTRASERVKWTRSKELNETRWYLFVLHHDANSNLLYVASTKKDSNFEGLAHAVGATSQLTGEVMFRSLGKIGRLVFNNLGVTKHGRRNLSFAMYTGADVKQALSETEKRGSRKSNISGYGWEHGRQITIGCSHKGRVWSKAGGTIPKFNLWAEGVGAKLVDESIDTKSVIANVLIPEYADSLPEHEVLSLEWPVELFSVSEDRVSILDGDHEHDLYMLDPVFDCIDRDLSQVSFSIVASGEEGVIAQYRMTVHGQAGFELIELSGKALLIRVGNKEYDLTSFFNSYPPLVRFVDLSELDGNIILKAENSGLVEVPHERLVPWVWADVDITKESIWKDGVKRENSIQWFVARFFVDNNFDVVFDDDGSGEAADLICLKQEENFIRLVLVHCKYSASLREGARIKDVVEVSSQAVRSARRVGKFEALLKHIRNRDQRRGDLPDYKRFRSGSHEALLLIERASRFKEVKPEILIVQPGVSKSRLSQDQSVVLGAADSYIKQTLGIDLVIICSE